MIARVLASYKSDEIVIKRIYSLLTLNNKIVEDF